MITLQRTDSSNADFIHLVQQLDALLSMIDGKEHSFYHQFNQIDSLQHVVVAFEDGKAVACGAMKTHSENAMEIKRMFTIPKWRSKGLALQVLTELETWAKEEGCKTCVLETGIRLPEAIALYQKSGYKRIPNYGQYVGVDNSVCFEKEL